jgi:DNA-binding transcriptional MerR regulator
MRCFAHPDYVVSRTLPYKTNSKSGEQVSVTGMAEDSIFRPLLTHLRLELRACSGYRPQAPGGVVMSAGIRIGELSRRTGCNIETIRYYERIGLLPAPVRSAGRYRLYDTADLRRLSFIRRARDLGSTLDEVRSLVFLSAKDEHVGLCPRSPTGRKSPGRDSGENRRSTSFPFPPPPTRPSELLAGSR